MRVFCSARRIMEQLGRATLTLPMLQKPRTRIRDAQEFGLNVMTLAHQRRRRRELLRLG